MSGGKPNTAGFPHREGRVAGISAEDPTESPAVNTSEVTNAGGQRGGYKNHGKGPRGESLATTTPGAAIRRSIQGYI